MIVGLVVYDFYLISDDLVSGDLISGDLISGDLISSVFYLISGDFMLGWWF